jgi:LysR family cys regulon transcriptional activator
MSAMDADVLKAYAELGLGVGIIAAMAFSSKRDAGLRLIDSGHLFEPRTAMIAVRRGSYLRTYAYRFIELCSPALPEKAVRAAVRADAGKIEAKAESMQRRAAAAAQLWRSTGNTLSRDDVKRTA